MKTLIASVCPALLMMLAPFSLRADVYAAITPSIPDSDVRESLYGSIGHFILVNLQPGETFTLYNGWTMTPIVSFKLPESQAYTKDLKVRGKVLSPMMNTLAEWMRKTEEIGSAMPAYGLDVPRIFSFLAENTNAAKDHSPILLAGSSLVATPEMAFHFVDGLYPADSHLRGDKTQTVFGLQGSEGRLGNCPVYWITLDKGYLNAAHEARVDRFWQLFTQFQGARLAAFVHDSKTVLDKLASRDVRPLASVEMESGEKIEMRRIKAYDLASSGAGSFMDRAVNQATVPPLTSTRFLNAKIGIKWTGDIDLDLYVQPGSSTKELSYRCSATPLGRHTKDWLSEPAGNAYETIDLLEQRNGTSFDLSSLRVSVNLYRGSKAVKEVSGIVRMEVEKKIYEEPFRIRLSDGDRGKDDAWQTRQTSGHWVIIDPLRLTKFDKLRAQTKPALNKQPPSPREGAHFPGGTSDM